MFTQTQSRRIAHAMSACVTLLAGAYVASQGIGLLTGHDRLFGLTPMLDLDEECNIPSFFQTCNLLFAAVLLGRLAMMRRRYRLEAFSWALLACTFVFLAADELLSIHEALTAPVRQRLHTSGSLAFAWIIPYGLAAAVLGLGQLGFLLRLPRWLAARMCVAGAVFVGGAIGMEMVGGWLVSWSAPRALLDLEVLVEETLELCGIALFNCTLISVMVPWTIEQWRAASGVALPLPGHRRPSRQVAALASARRADAA